MPEPFIIFFNDGHTYWKNKERIYSVGHYINLVSNPFEGRYWSTHSALKGYFGKEYSEHFSSFKSKQPPARDLYRPFLDKIDDAEFIRIKKDIRNQWDYKRTVSQWKGTRFHEQREAEAYERGLLWNKWQQKDYPVINIEKEYDNQTLADNLYDLEDGAYLELLVFDPVFNICGQADMVYIETVDNVRYFDIDDHKTNEKKPPTSGRDFFGSPLEHLRDGKHNRYMLQINLYAKLLSRHGFIPRNLGYTWYKDYDPDSGELIEFPYLEDEMNAFYAEHVVF